MNVVHETRRSIVVEVPAGVDAGKVVKRESQRQMKSGERVESWNIDMVRPDRSSRIRVVVTTR
jgi:hypothetical protein